MNGFEIDINSEDFNTQFVVRLRAMEFRVEELEHQVARNLRSTIREVINIIGNTIVDHRDLLMLLLQILRLIHGLPNDIRGIREEFREFIQVVVDMLRRNNPDLILEGENPQQTMNFSIDF